MLTCRICGDKKPGEEFLHITNFTKYKKHPVIWCKDCQKLWMDMRKEREFKQRKLALTQDTEKFIVSFM